MGRVLWVLPTRCGWVPRAGRLASVVVACGYLNSCFHAHLREKLERRGGEAENKQGNRKVQTKGQGHQGQSQSRATWADIGEDMDTPN